MSDSFNLSSLKNLRKNSSVEAIKSKIAATEKKTDYSDSRFWSVTRDDLGNGTATVRFLPWKGMGEGDLEYIKQYEHSFKQNGQWYIELCRTTIGDKDPVVEYCNDLWADGTEQSKTRAREMKRKLSYIANVYIVNDPANPENNGKVFLFKFGAKIFEKLKDSIEPKFDDEVAVNPFDVFEGANVKLRMTKVDNQTNWSKTTIESPSALCDGDEEKMVEVLNMTYGLKEFLDPSRFKEYDVLEERLMKVVKGSGSRKPNNSFDPDADVFDSARPRQEREASAPRMREAASTDDDDIDEFFRE